MNVLRKISETILKNRLFLYFRTRVYNLSTMKILEFIALLLGIFAALTWFFDSPERMRNRTIQAWEIVAIDTPGNSGKIAALEYLNSENTQWWSISKKKREPLVGIDLSEPSWPGVFLDSVQLPNSVLSYARFHHATLVGANLSGAQLDGSAFRVSNLREADLTDANFDGSCHRSTNFEKTTMKNTTFRWADLTDSPLVSIKSMEGVNFSRANLSNANFNGSDISKASFDDGIGRSEQAWYLVGMEPKGISLELLEARTEKPEGFYAFRCERE